MSVPDAPAGQAPAQRLAVELRGVAGPRHGPDVDQEPDPEAQERSDEIVEGSRGVPDRVQPHRVGSGLGGSGACVLAGRTVDYGAAGRPPTVCTTPGWPCR